MIISLYMVISLITADSCSLEDENTRILIILNELA